MRFKALNINAICSKRDDYYQYKLSRRIELLKKFIFIYTQKSKFVKNLLPLESN
jgi:hypothetical protein